MKIIGCIIVSNRVRHARCVEVEQGVLKRVCDLSDPRMPIFIHTPTSSGPWATSGHGTELKERAGMASWTDASGHGDPEEDVD